MSSASPFPKSSIVMLVTLFLMGTCQSGHAQTPYDVSITNAKQVGVSPKKLEQIGPAVQELIENQKLAGAVVLVARKGEIIFTGSFGWADIANDKSMQTETAFRIYSMTKPITSIAVLILEERNLLDLDDPVSQYIPAFKNLNVYAGSDGNDNFILEDMAREITIRDLLRHTSGLTYDFLDTSPVGKMYEEQQVATSDNLEAMVDKLKTIPLTSQPGEKFTYGVSTDVLGFLVEKVSGMSFPDFLHQEIFVPLTMTETAFQLPESAKSRFAKVYDSEGEQIVEAKDPRIVGEFLSQPTMFSGGGGLISTAKDYLKFCEMLRGKGKFEGKRIVSGKTIKAMTQNQLPAAAYPISIMGKQEGVGFGLGVSVVTEITEFSDTARVGEYGWDGIASTHFWISPKDDLIVIALSQNMPFSHQLRDVLRPIVYKALSP
ncbi:MAG: beta-lactamase family protein [Planctomycetaceae bacterium]|jgi:CubicO group peptidase (beta-lactamase class C family)|nr:beta-lactamase family protein [Planctomycetaceae bacterium]